MKIISGWLEGVRQVPLNRYGERQKPLDLSLVVIHSISLPPNHFGGPFIDAIFTGTLDPLKHPFFAQVYKLEVSTHIFIDRFGKISQYVSFLDRAWHAGRSCFNGRKECNEYAIGIELEGCDYCSYTIEQYKSLDEVLDAIYKAYPKTLGNIVGHNEIAPTRKTDPGPYFNWSRYR